MCVYKWLLAEFTRAVADDNIIDFRLVTILLVELLLGVLDELLIEVVANKVDGTATKAATHDTRTSNTVLLGHIVQEVELLARNLVVLRQTFVGLVHQFAHLLVVAFVEGFADAQYTVFLTEYELCALVVLGADLFLHFLQLLPSAVAQGLILTLWMLGLNAWSLDGGSDSLLWALRSGYPVICAMNPGDFTYFGHFIVLISADDDGNIRLLDSNSRIRTQKLWHIDDLMWQIAGMWAFSYDG